MREGPVATAKPVLPDRHGAHLGGEGREGRRGGGEEGREGRRGGGEEEGRVKRGGEGWRGGTVEEGGEGRGDYEMMSWEKAGGEERKRKGEEMKRERRGRGAYAVFAESSFVFRSGFKLLGFGLLDCSDFVHYHRGSGVRGWW